MITLLRKLLGRPDYQALNRIEVSKKNLLKNFRYLSSINRKVKIAPVLKSNAYGHGSTIIGKLLDNLGCPFFCVDSLFEAYQLLKANVKTPILIMGYIEPRNLAVKKLPFSYTIYDLKMAEAVSRYQKEAEVHIFVDTGMHREGLMLSDLPKFLKEAKKFNLKIVGLMSHLAIGGRPNHPLTKKQIKDFNKAIIICKEGGIKLRFTHLGGSNAILHTKSKRCNLIRVGLALYGIDPQGQNPHLSPVLSLKTKIGLIKEIEKGDSVGYNAKFSAKNRMIIGILPVGYYDGVDRRLSGKGTVLVNRTICPILGFASMNITTIDLSKVENPYVGQEVVVFSNEAKHANSIERAANICQTTSYDLLVGLSSSTKRVVV